jgi:hypothetical protein
MGGGAMSHHDEHPRATIDGAEMEEGLLPEDEEELADPEPE